MHRDVLPGAAQEGTQSAPQRMNLFVERRLAI